MQRASRSSWLSSWWLARTIETTRPFARGELLDVGCGAAPYRGFFDVTRHVTLDWPSSLHRRDFIDVYASAEALPFTDASFDTVLCTEVLEHLRDPRAAIAEAARVLRPGGHLILSIPFLYGIHERPYDFTRFTEHGLRHLLETHRFEPVHFVERGGSLAVIADLASKIGQRVGRSALDAARVPRAASDRVLDAAIIAPQLVVAMGTRLAEHRLPRLAALVGGSRIATLGYVVVGRKE
jgi:SAM-dependent methyltransferase